MHTFPTNIEAGNGANIGTITSVQSSVVDVRFEGRLPSLNQELLADTEQRILIEVATHLHAKTIRGIALSPPRGLARGTTVLDTGETFVVPVGEALVGRMRNIYGERSFDAGQSPSSLAAGPKRLARWDALEGVRANPAPFSIVVRYAGARSPSDIDRVHQPDKAISTSCAA